MFPCAKNTWAAAGSSCRFSSQLITPCGIGRSRRRPLRGFPPYTSLWACSVGLFKIRRHKVGVQILDLCVSSTEVLSFPLRWSSDSRGATGFRFVCNLDARGAGGSSKVSTPVVPPDLQRPLLSSPCNLEVELFLWDGSVTDTLPNVLVKTEDKLFVHTFVVWPTSDSRLGRSRAAYELPVSVIWMIPNQHSWTSGFTVQIKFGDERADSRPSEGAERAAPQPPCSSLLFLLPHHLILHPDIKEVPVLPRGQMLQVKPGPLLGMPDRI